MNILPLAISNLQSESAQSQAGSSGEGHLVLCGMCGCPGHREAEEGLGPTWGVLEAGWDADPPLTPQLKQETQSLCCCLLLVSEDNHQLFCQVGATGPAPSPDPHRGLQDTP